MADEPLDCECTVVFDIYKLTAPEGHDIDIMIAREAVAESYPVIFGGIVVHMVVTREARDGAAELLHRLKHLIVNGGAALFFEPYARDALALVICGFELLHRDMEERDGGHDAAFVAVYLLCDLLDGLFIPRDLVVV